MSGNDEEFLTQKEAIKYLRISREAIFLARQKNRLKFYKEGKYVYFKKSDLDDYIKSKFLPSLRRTSDTKELIFDLNTGFFSIPVVAKVLSDSLGYSYSAQHLYYLIRIGLLRCYKKGIFHLISREDAIELLEKERNKNPDKVRRGRPRKHTGKNVHH